MSLEDAVLKIEHKFECVTCTCGLIFAVPSAVRERWVETGSGFQCPMGHPLSYQHSELSKMRKELERSQAETAKALREKEFARSNAAAERQAREKTERRLTATRGAHTRTRNRIKNGVCPCCTRSFQNLRSHMKTKHPEFQAEEKVSS